MKKILLVFVMIFSGMITYQLILGSNGLFESMRVKKEREYLDKLIILRESEKSDIESLIQGLSKNDEIYTYLASIYGYYPANQSVLRVIHEYDDSTKDTISFDAFFSGIATKYRGVSNQLEEEYYGYEIKLARLRNIISIVFFIFFGFFIILAIFGTNKFKRQK